MNTNESHFQYNRAFSQMIASSHQSLLAGIQILLVEDEIDVAELLIILLEGVGARVVWATQAEEALAILRQFHPDVLISNIRLPEQDGTWLIQQIRSAETDQGCHLPAIAVTSYPRDTSKQKILAAGFEKYLLKLDDPEKIVAEVAKLVHAPTDAT